MTADRSRRYALPALSLLFALAAPYAVLVLLRPDGPVAAVPAVAAALVLLTLARRFLPPGPRRALTALVWIGYGFFAVVLVIYIVVIPFTYYLAWLDLVRSGRPGGIISFLFYSVTAFFAAVLAGTIPARGFARAAAGLALVIVFEALVIWQTPALAAAFTGVGLVAVFLLIRTPKTPVPRRFVLPSAILAASIAGAAFLATGSPPNSGALVRTGLLNDVKRIIVGLFPDLSALSSVAGYGYAFDREELGRKPVISSVPLFRVEDRRPGFSGPVYLRTQVFDEYFNNNWGVSRVLLERMDRPASEVKIGGAGEIRVTTLFDYVPFLPHTLDTREIGLPSDTHATLDGGGPDTGYNLRTPLVRGDAVSLGLFPPAAAFSGGFNVRPRSEDPLSAAGGDPEREGRYLVVPSSVTLRVRDLAAALSAGPQAPARTLENIVRHLESGFAYTLDTRLPPDKEEFVDDFLFVTRRGFCVHFATSFIMLARLNGIPARYATGFLAVPRPGRPAITVSGYQAHAWPEVWLPETGWVTMEATPALDPDLAGLPDYYRTFNPSGDAFTARQLEALMGEVIPPPRREEPSAAGVLRAVIVALPWLGAAAVALAAAFSVGRAVKRRRALKRTYRGRLRRFNRRLCALVTRMERQGVPPPETAGWISWGRELKGRFPERSGAIDALVGTANGVFFARREAGRRQIVFIRRMARRLAAGPRGTPTRTGRAPGL